VIAAGATSHPPRSGEVAHRAGGASPRALKPTTLLARRLRKEMSLPEVLLWQQLRGQQLGVKFRRQHGIGSYVVDFYCAALRLAVEIDGEVHGLGGNAAYDLQRDAFIRENGHEIIHIPAADVLHNLAGVVELISSRVATPLHQASPATSPDGGGF
jgi:very-short-patch-repair endonuclease